MKRLILGGLAAAVVAGGLALAVPATPAHAATGSFLSCLNASGFVITDASLALNLGNRIQNDEMNNLPRAQILWNLENIWGLDPYKASVFIDCAWTTPV
jgi:hypothetical protein